MTNLEKHQQLRNFKILATGLFLLMMAIFITLTILQKDHNQAWMGYVRAFAEAGMVGALADWFAVTALFHRPLGLPIPHTNLIENSKQRIGDNLGNFVVDNFLTGENIKPYIKQLQVTKYLTGWLSKEKNKQFLIEEVSKYAKNIILNLDDKTIAEMIAGKGKELIDNFKINAILANGMDYILDKGLHEKILNFLTEKLKTYIAENEDLVKERVKKESSFLIPGFVDNIIAKKITAALSKYIEEIEQDRNHKVRADIEAQIRKLTNDIRTKAAWEKDLNELKAGLLTEEKTALYANDIWISIKKSVVEGLENPDSGLRKYFEKSLNDLTETFSTDEELIAKTDKWVRYNVYKAILKNASKAGDLISNTVGNWKGRDLSEKLELEVGKDLQFIRINGTIVGGLVGLLIYTLVHHLL